MNTYATYEFYIESYRCFSSDKASEIVYEDFQHYALLASALIDNLTYGNIPDEDYSEKVCYCCCELAERMFSLDNSESSGKDGIASESVTGWSQSYESSETRQSSTKQAYKEIIYKWLSNTGYLFRGVYNADEC